MCYNNTFTLCGVLLEGGIISYDTNIITVVLVLVILVRVAPYRQDRVTIYLRNRQLTENFKICLYFKTILSQSHRSKPFSMLISKDY
jgi:hypothetical protein